MFKNKYIIKKEPLKILKLFLTVLLNFLFAYLNDIAGIGGGCFGTGGNITITGGNITAGGGSGGADNGGAGIGGGLWKDGGNISINGEGVVVKATGAGASANIGGGASWYTGGIPVSGGTIAKTTGIIFEGTSGKVYGDVTLGGPLDCDGKALTVLGGSILNILNGGEITDHGNFNNSGLIENHGVIGSVSGTGTTRHYVSSISKNIKEPTTATIGDSIAKSISALSPTTITVAYNGTARTLTGIWSVKDKDGNPITDLAGTIVGADDSYTYTLTFKSEDNIYFDPLNMSLYNMEKANSNLSNYEVYDPYISSSGPGGGGSTLTYSYVVASAPAVVTPPVVTPPVVTQAAVAWGITIQLGANTNQTISITIESIKSKDLGIDCLSVLTQDDAGNAIDRCSKAIDKVSQIRATLGGYQNRLEHAINYITNTEENLQYSESRIRDMDMAKGIMEYSKYQILLQTGQAMLGQANQWPKSVLELLS